MLTAWTSSNPEKKYYAVNDVVVAHSQELTLLKIETWVNDALLNTYFADGIIFSTPTGSTAYALSAGGPIIHPTLDVILTVPVCSHGLAIRPIVLPPNDIIKVRVTNRKNVEMGLYFDGDKLLQIKQGENIYITRSPYKVKMLHSESWLFFDVLREKFNLGYINYKG